MRNTETLVAKLQEKFNEVEMTSKTAVDKVNSDLLTWTADFKVDMLALIARGGVGASPGIESRDGANASGQKFSGLHKKDL